MARERSLVTQDRVPDPLELGQRTNLFVDHFCTYYSPCFWCVVVLDQHFVEDVSDHFLRRCVASHDVLGPDSVVVTCFTSFEFINRSLYFILCEL